MTTEPHPIATVHLPASAYEGLPPAVRPDVRPVDTNAVTRAAIEHIEAESQWLPLPEGVTVSEVLRSRNEQLAALDGAFPEHLPWEEA